MENTNVESWLGEKFRLMKKDLATVAICALSYSVIHLYTDLKAERKANDEQKQEQLKFLRDAYKLQSDNTFELLKTVKKHEDKSDSATVR